MPIVEIKKTLTYQDLPFPVVQITYDDIGRYETTTYTYRDIVVSYSVTWQGLTNQLDTYTQSIEEVT